MLLPPPAERDVTRWPRLTVCGTAAKEASAPEGCDITGGATLAPEAAERRGLGEEEKAGAEEAAPPLDSRPAERDLTTSGAPVMAEPHAERTSAPEPTLGGDAPLLASPAAVPRGDGDSEG